VHGYHHVAFVIQLGVLCALWLLYLAVE